MKIIDDFSYESPCDLNEALALLKKHGQDSRPLAGGTDLLVAMKHRSILQSVPGCGTQQAPWRAARRVAPVLTPKVLVSLNRIEDLKGMAIPSPDTVVVKPLSTMTEIAKDTGIAVSASALVDAASIMGSPLIRNRATVGGNIVNARPAADTVIATMAIGARFELKSVNETRFVDAADFYTGPGTNIRKWEELLTAIHIPNGPFEGSAYFRQGNRRQLEIALVGASAWIRLDSASGVVIDARLVLGAVGPIPVLSSSAAKALRGSIPDDDTIRHAASEARKDAKPIDDYRGSAAYRLELVEALSERAIRKALERAKSNGDVR